MAKRKTASASSAPPDVDPENPELGAAIEEVRAARQRLREARSRYEELLHAAVDSESADQDGKSLLHSAFSETLELVKKYPGPGLICAALAGFFLGRLFRR